MTRYLKLLADNRQCLARRFEVRAASADTAEILLYDAIVDTAAEAEWFGGVAADAFVRELRGITASTINLRINSPGGSVFAARAMEQALRDHKASVVVHIDGIAASAASFLAMAGDEIIISKGAMLMVHKAWTMAFGNETDLIKTAALLGKIDDTLVTTYVDRTKQTPQQITDWMAAETWFTGQEAIDAGFADRLAAQPPNNAQAAWNLSAYLGAPVEQLATEDHRYRQRQRARVALLTAPIA